MAKSSRRVVAPKIKTAFLLSPEAFHKLGAASLREGKTQSAIVEELIGRALSGYSVTLRGPGLFGGPGAINDRPAEATDVKREEIAA